MYIEGGDLLDVSTESLCSIPAIEGGKIFLQNIFQNQTSTDMNECGVGHLSLISMRMFPGQWLFLWINNSLCNTLRSSEISITLILWPAHSFPYCKGQSSFFQHAAVRTGGLLIVMQRNVIVCLKLHLSILLDFINPFHCECMTI